MKRILSLIFVLIFALFAFTGCRKTPQFTDIDFSTVSEFEKFTESSKKTDYVLIEFKDYGKIVIRLYPDVAPIAVTRFKELVAAGFYNGLTIHRIEKDFVIQGGDPAGTGGGDSGWDDIAGEFNSNGFENNLKHLKGVVGMARSQKNDTASTQFYICTQNANALNGKYTTFGFVIFGMDIIDTLNEVETENTTPLETVYITSAKFVKLEK